MMLAYRVSQRQVFCSVLLDLLTFSKLSLSILCLSIILMSWKRGKNLFSFISVYSTPSVNLAPWLFRHPHRQYALLLHSPHTVISFFYLLLGFLPPPPISLHLYLILQLLNPLPQQGILSLCISQPLLDVLIGSDQGEVGSDRFIASTHRYRTLSSSGVGRLMFKDANVIIHCQGLHACTGLLCSR